MRQKEIGKRVTVDDHRRLLDESVFIRSDALHQQLSGVGIFPLVTNQRRVATVPPQYHEKNNQAKNPKPVVSDFGMSGRNCHCYTNVWTDTKKQVQNADLKNIRLPTIF